MRKLWISGILTVAALWAASMPATSALHDFCVNPVADAPGSFKQAGLLAANNCDGEMLINADNEDWYYVDVEASSASPHINVNLCPTAAKTGPWNADLEVYYLELGQLLDLHGSVLVFYYNLASPPNPGTLVGSSNNASGCDSVSADASGLAPFGRWYIHILRTSGDGFYNLQTNAT